MAPKEKRPRVRPQTTELTELTEVDRLRDDFAQLKEEFTLAQRVIEDWGWANLSNERATFVKVNRLEAMQKSRFHALYNPLLKQAIRLTIDFTFGQGVGWSCNDPDLRGVVDAFWRNPHNQKVLTGFLAQREQFKNLYVDGGLYFVLFVNEESGSVIVRTIPYEEINEIVTDPDDAARPLLYRRVRTKQTYDFKANNYATQTETLWYRDYQATSDSLDAIEGAPERIENGVIYHLAINRNGKFGLPEAFASLDWGKAFREFIQDRASINKAATQISMKKKIKGGAGAIEAERQRLVGRLDDVSKWPLTPNAGSVLLENEGVNTEWFKTDTGAASAHEDARMLLLPFCAGTGIYAHYLGDGGDANLATATSMNAPMMRSFQAWQTLWETVYTDLFGFLLREKVRRQQIKGAKLVTNQDSGLEEIEWEPRPLYDANGRPVPDQTPQPGLAQPTVSALAESPGAAAGAIPVGNDKPVGPDLSGDGRPNDGTDADGYPTTVNPQITIQFPPVVARETAQILQALGQIYAMALPHVPSAQKSIARFFLGEMGVNDVEQEVGIWFAEQEEAQRQAAAVAQQAMTHQANLALIRGTAGKLGPDGRPLPILGAGLGMGDASGDTTPQDPLAPTVKVVEPPSASRTPQS